jgi:hypothetical protein
MDGQGDENGRDADKKRIELHRFFLEREEYGGERWLVALRSRKGVVAALQVSFGMSIVYFTAFRRRHSA